MTQANEADDDLTTEILDTPDALVDSLLAAVREETGGEANLIQRDPFVSVTLLLSDESEGYRQLILLGGAPTLNPEDVIMQTVIIPEQLVQYLAAIATTELPEENNETE